MATRQNNELDPSKIIGAISRLTGALVGTAVFAGRKVIISVAPVGRNSSGKLKEKTGRAPAKRKKKATHKKKKKIAKRKGTSPARKSGISKAKSTQAPAKRKKKATRKKKKKGPKAKKKLKTAKRKGAIPPRN
jgi:hypothetical protein